ncbi:MAG: amino acid ABC transporter permease [Anaerolineaceae bacterium]|jgi:polar amino acid transport system permease protein|nr:amino acid ABC transporter permease [Anaerolineaceae bacterium]
MAKKQKNSEPNASGPKKAARHFDSGWYLLFAVISIILFLVITQPDPYLNMLKFFKEGIWITIYVTVVSFILVLVVGLIGGLGRVSGNKVVRGIATTYVEIIRGIPLLVQLLFWYFAMPALIQQIGRVTGNEALSNYQTNAIAMAIVGLTIGYGAYMSEVVRAGIQSIPKGQMEAARSLGLTYFQAMQHIILPQAFRVILPAIGNEFITLLKDSSLVSVVAVADLTRRGREYSAIHFNTLQTWSMVALVYLVMTLLSARLVAYTERKTKSER